MSGNNTQNTQALIRSEVWQVQLEEIDGVDEVVIRNLANRQLIRGN